MVKQQRAASLIELIVTMGLLSIALLLFYSLTMSWMRKTQETELALDLQTEALKALTWINSEFSESNEQGVDDRLDVGELGISFVSPRDLNGIIRLDASGQLMWQKYVCFYLGNIDGNQALLMKQVAVTSPSSELPSPLPVATMIANSATPRVIARNVTLFQGDADKLVPWDITIETRAKYGSQEFGVRLQTSVFFRN